MSESDEQAPDRVVAGRYRLERVLGRGGMGVVWLATDTLIERRVALKEVRPPSGVTGADETSFGERALREARNAGRLNHPGVVAVHDVIAPAGDDDAVYIVMEYVEAPTLGDLIDRQGPLPAARVAAMGAGILDALTAAHALGIVHRDIKPSNVLVRDGDRVKLTDFGIALAAEDSRLTRSGVMGTHGYLAPEAFDTGQVGPAADLWALGATLFHAIAGRPPFQRDTTTATLRAILFENPPAPPCGPPLADVITGLLTRPIDERLTSDAAREKLGQAATAPTPAPPEGPPTDGQAAWEAQATTAHRPPPTGTPPAPTWGQATPPGGPPTPSPTAPPTHPGAPTGSPYAATSPSPPAQPPTRPGGPTSGTYPTSGPGWPRQTAPTSGPSWAGAAPQRKSNTPLLVGGIVAAAAVLLLVVILAASGGSDSEGGGGNGGPVAQGDSTVPGGDAPVGNGGPQALVLNFLEVVNGGNTDAAIDLLCPVGDTQDDIDAITDVAGEANLEMDSATSEMVDDVVYAVDLTGTVRGESISYGHVSAAERDGCIVGFSVTTG